MNREAKAHSRQASPRFHGRMELTPPAGQAGAQHTVTVTRRGRLRLHNHPDLETELIAAALAGTEPCACIQLLAALRQSTASPAVLPLTPVSLSAGGFVNSVRDARLRRRSERATRPSWGSLRTRALRRVYGVHRDYAFPRGQRQALWDVLSRPPTTGELRDYLRAHKALHGLPIVLKCGGDYDYIEPLKVYELPHDGRPGRARAIVPGRGKSWYAADVTLRLGDEQVWFVARRIPGQAPPPATTAASRAAARVGDIEALRAIVKEETIPSVLRRQRLAYSRADGGLRVVIVGWGFPGPTRHRRARAVEPSVSAGLVATLPPGAIRCRSGGTVKNAYKGRAEMEVTVAVRLKRSIVVFHGVADAHGTDGDAKAVGAAVSRGLAIGFRSNAGADFRAACRDALHDVAKAVVQAELRAAS